MKKIAMSLLQNATSTIVSSILNASNIVNVSNIMDNIRNMKNSKPIKNIAVCATMSAGKTTFVNALLGTDVLPSRNEATTAKITSVYDKDGAENLSGYAYAQNGDIIEGSDNVTLSIINEWNENLLVKRIILQGDLDNITSKDFVCAIHDTPGTNNSGDKTHHDITIQFLENNPFTCIIYVANCQHLCTTDEKKLLNELYNRVILKQKIPVIFILNKADAIDREKEDFIKMLSDYKQSLQEIGFDDFKIFPFSAKNARLLKMALKNRASQFTETEKDAFFSIVNKFSKGTDLTGSIINSSDSNFQIEVDGEIYNSIQLNMALKHTGLMEIEKEIENILTNGR